MKYMSAFVNTTHFFPRRHSNTPKIVYPTVIDIILTITFFRLSCTKNGIKEHNPIQQIKTRSKDYVADLDNYVSVFSH